MLSLLRLSDWWCNSQDTILVPRFNILGVHIIREPQRPTKRTSTAFANNVSTILSPFLDLGFCLDL